MSNGRRDSGRTRWRRQLRWVSAIVVLAILASCGSSTAELDGSDAARCLDPMGRSDIVEVDGLDAIVHLPPCFGSLGAGLPTLYLLHGAGMSPESWQSPAIDAETTIDALVSTGEIDPIVVVFAPRATMRSGFAEIVLDPLIEQVEVRYDVGTSAQDRGIGGFSAAGPATALSTFSGPPRVAAVGFFAVTWPSPVTVEVADGMSDRTDRPAVRVDYGNRDRLQSNIADITEAMEPLGIEVELTVVDGAHDLDFVRDRLEVWLRWFDTQLS